MLKKDKQKVVGEALDATKVRRFLDMKPHHDEDVNFHVLTKAYRGLPPDAFEHFMAIYLAAGRPVNPVNRAGESFVAFISPNQSHPEYVEILQRLGA